MFELSANIEWLFAGQTDDDRSDPAARRVRYAAAAGVSAVEIWMWRNKNIDQIADALHETGIALQIMCVDPMGELVDSSKHEEFLVGLAETVEIAEQLRCPFLVVTAGDECESVSRGIQHEAIVDALYRATNVLRGRDVTLLLESLNSRIDHVGTFLDSTTECLEILKKVNSPKIRLLYDLYHSLMMGEQPEVVLRGGESLLAHVQIADIPGRHEPGSGEINWSAQLATLKGVGYAGRLGLEYRPSTDTLRSLEYIQSVVSGTA